MPLTTFIGGNESTLPLREIIHRLEVGRCWITVISPSIWEETLLPHFSLAGFVTGLIQIWHSLAILKGCNLGKYDKLIAYIMMMFNYTSKMNALINERVNWICLECSRHHTVDTLEWNSCLSTIWSNANGSDRSLNLQESWYFLTEKRGPCWPGWFAQHGAYP